MKKNILLLVVVSCQILVSASGLCNDLDDGISSYKEDSVKKYDELGKKDWNVIYIKMNAKSKAMVSKKSGKEIVMTGKDKNSSMNSVVMGPGSTVKGDIIIIDDSKGDKTVISE